VVVQIPAGVADGNRLRLSGEGAAGPRGAPPGDLYVEIQVESDDRFVRDGDDLIYNLEVGIAAAALGTEVTIPLIDGREETLRLDPGVQPGTVFRLKGEGMGRLNRRGRGDLLVRVDVRVPTALSKAEEEALRAFAELHEEQVRPNRRFRRAR
jgi:molecular chaperone DnaJ